MNESYIKVGMSKEEFSEWKKDWLDRIPKCRDFCCIHELTSCCIDRICACGTIESIWKKNKTECNDVSCEDCFHRYSCWKSGYETPWWME